MATLKDFVQATPRSLPVIVLADVSGSMSVEGKIQALNQSLREMISTFASAEELRAEIHVCVIAFGGQAWVHVPLQPAQKVQWSDMQSDGGTPMGAALVLAADLIEDHQAIPSRAYRPAVVLVSDGMPTDDWKAGLNRFQKDGRASKADRLALAIGGDADETMLAQFLPDAGQKVFHAEDARQIKSFFKFVTMTVTSRSRSTDPNQVPPVGDPFALDKF